MAGIIEKGGPASDAAAIAAQAAGSGQKFVTSPDSAFAPVLTRNSFRFEHTLRNHPLFQIPHLVDLSRRLPAHSEFSYWSSGSVSIKDPWDKCVEGRPSLQDTIANIATNNSIVILKHTEQDPVFGPVLQKLLGEFVELCGPRFRRDAMIGESIILIASPGRVTPYHVDAELNFVVQVVGDKPFYVLDRTAASQVTEDELERFSMGQHSAAVFSDEKQAQASSYDLRAGYGVHVPAFAPHWVKNGDSVSVALSINYEMRSVVSLTHTRRFNRRLRKLGVQPAQPGRSSVRDALKAQMDSSFGKLKELVKPAPARPQYGVWTPKG